MYVMRPNIKVKKYSYVHKVFKLVRDHWPIARKRYAKARVVWNCNPNPVPAKFLRLLYENKCIWLNRPENIKYSNNYEVYKMFKNTDYYPPTTDNYAEVQNMLDENDLVVAKKASSFQCRGVKITSPEFVHEYKDYNIFQKFLDIDREYRVVVLKPNLAEPEFYWVVNTAKKVKTEDWSYDNLHAFEWTSLGIYPRLNLRFWDIVHDVVKKVPLNLFAIDIMHDRENRKWWLGELNIQFGFGRFLVRPMLNAMRAVENYWK